MHTSSRVDTRNPQAAHIALAGTTIAIHIRHRAHDGFMGWTEKASTCTTMALGHLEKFFIFLVCDYATFLSRHRYSSMPVYYNDSYLLRHKEEDVTDDEYHTLAV